MPSKRHGYLTRKEWLAERLEDARDRAGAFDVARLLSSIVRVEVGPLQPGGDPLRINGLLLHGYAEIEARVLASNTPPLKGLELFGVGPDLDIEIPSGPPHVDCDCMACRPWTT
jgi:hypothetical protein